MPLICLDCRYVRPKPSGIGMVVGNLIEWLPELEPDWRFLFLRNAERQTPLSDAPNVEERVVGFGANTPHNLWLLPKFVDLGGVDLFHSPSNILPAGLVMRSITTIHDLMWINQPELCNPTVWGRIERLFYQSGMLRALQKSDAIIAVSEATRQDIAKYDPGAGSRTHAILSGVSKAFKPISTDLEALRPLGLEQGEYVLTVGQNAPYKNHAGAVRGFAQALPSAPKMKLALVQRRGESAKSLEQLANDLGIEDNVVFIEPVNDEQLIQLYCGALALLHPSICEGFGMPIAEAMACGCPVITSNISAMPEVAGGAATLVDPHDPQAIAKAILDIARDANVQESLRANGLERAAQLSWKRCAEQHIKVYRQVLSRD